MNTFIFYIVGKNCNCTILFLNCVTALIMWVKVCPPSNWVGPDRKPGETRVPVVLYHTWPSSPVSPTMAPHFHQSSEKAGQTLQEEFRAPLSQPSRHTMLRECRTQQPHYTKDWRQTAVVICVSCPPLVLLMEAECIDPLTSVSSAAVVDLNGRYFGGRVVKACFYNLDKFRVLDLGEQV